MNRKGYIVCVENEPKVLSALKNQLLESFSSTHEVETAENAVKAIEVVEDLIEKNNIIEMVITDQRLPHMTGNEFLVKVHDQLPETIKILIGEHDDIEDAKISPDNKIISKYIERPWDKQHLKESIAQLIDRFHQKLENTYMINNLEIRAGEIQKEK